MTRSAVKHVKYHLNAMEELSDSNGDSIAHEIQQRRRMLQARYQDTIHDDEDQERRTYKGN
jgi:hypothetical protein